MILDLATKDTFLQAQIDKFTKLKNEGIIDSVKSAVIGSIYLYAFNSYINIISEPSEKIEKIEKDFDEAFLRRVPEILSKINMLLNL